MKRTVLVQVDEIAQCFRTLPLATVVARAAAAEVVTDARDNRQS